MEEHKAAGVIARFIRGWVKPLVVTIAIVSTFRSAVADWHDVPTQSMEPTILVGDRIVVNKLAYDLKVPFTTWHVAAWSDPAPGDIVTLHSPTTGQRMVKRVVGVPGDVIQLVNNQLSVNGKPVPQTAAPAGAVNLADLTDPPPHLLAMELTGGALHTLLFQPMRPAARSFGPLTVPSGQYFVMGDNRDNSADSRFFGLVPRDQIVGHVIGVGVSLDRRNWYMPRWKRFFKDLS